MSRADQWRAKLMGTPEQIEMKRTLYTSFVDGRDDADRDIVQTIDNDIPRTFPDVAWMHEHKDVIRALLISYAAVHRGDSYLQGFNYLMATVYRVFHDQEHALPDTWWCFSRVVSLVRSLMPDFNVTWFHWCRRHWFGDFHRRLRRNSPALESILRNHHETFSTLTTVKWFMLWFCQTVVYEELLELWDFLIDIDPQSLMRAYTLITFEILLEASPTISYNWSQNPAEAVHSIIAMRVRGVKNIVRRVKRCL